MSEVAKKPATADLTGAFKEIVEGEISKFIKGLPDISPLTDAISYALESGGKRIRPVIFLSILSDLGMPVERFSPLALSLELIHISSLIHDDLPALDNDDLRRGKKTCHVMFNEATAILAGDAIVPLALEHLQKVELSPKKMLNVCRIISSAYRDVCFGQQLDLNPPGSRPDITAIAKLKTGSLFAAAVSVPFEIYESPPEMLKKVWDLGIGIGILYQICDDLADYSDSVRLKGREVNSDLKNQKDTFHNANQVSANELMQKVKEDILKSINEIELDLENSQGLSNFRNALNLLFSNFPALSIKFG